MPTKELRPITHSGRGRQILDYSGLSKVAPEKTLLVAQKNKAGRNNLGKITVRHKGGGNKKAYRLIDFKRNSEEADGVVLSLEYDPNRTANIALVQHENGGKSYILAPEGLKVGSKVTSRKDSDIKVGNSLPLSEIPVGTTIHNVELTIGGGAKLVRSAGVAAVLVAKNEQYASVKLPSGEVRLIHIKCKATVGQVSNSDHRNRKLGKAGATRWVRRRPQVRGSVMNPCDHPHGGGEGRAPIGRSAPRTPWGKKAMGLKTRSKKKISNRFILNKKK